MNKVIYHCHMACMEAATDEATCTCMCHGKNHGIALKMYFEIYVAKRIKESDVKYIDRRATA